MGSNGQNGHQPNNVIDEIQEHLNQVSTPLAVVSGYVQLLQRRMSRGKHIDHEQLAVALQAMRRATRDIEAAMHDLRERHTHKKNGA